MPDMNWIVQTITMLALGIIAYFMKDLKNSIQKDIAENKQKIEDTNCQLERFKEEFNDFKVEQAKEIANQFKDYVSKSEFVRVTANYERKMDKIYDAIMSIKNFWNKEG
jgi:cell division protein FtsL